MDQYGWFTPDMKNCTLYDPCFFNGKVKRVFESLGFENVIHVNENFWASWPIRVDNIIGVGKPRITIRVDPTVADRKS